MSFFGSIGKLFHSSGAVTATQIGTTIGAAAGASLNPGLGALIELIGNAIIAAEVNGGSGAQKKDTAKAIIDTTTPVTVQVLSQIAGHPVTDPASVAPTLDKMIDDLVALFNALGVLSHQTVTPADAAKGTKSPTL